MVRRRKEKIGTRWFFSIAFIFFVLPMLPSFRIPAMAQDPPVVVSVTPAPGSAVRDPNFRASAIIGDKSGKGVDLSPTGSTIKLFYPSGSLVFGRQSDNGVDTIYWDLARPLPADGFADGLYAIVVTPKDRPGRWGDTVSVGFICDTWVPVVRETSPANGEILRSTSSRFMAAIDDGNGRYSVVTIPADGLSLRTMPPEIEAVLEDISGTGINSLSSAMKLLGPDGKEVEATISNGEKKLILLPRNPFPTDGEADGIYELRISAVDNAGNGSEYWVRFRYDTVPPAIASVVPAQGEVLRSLRDIVIEFRDDGSGMDFRRTSASLFDPTGRELRCLLTNNGLNMLRLIPSISPGYPPPEGRYKVGVVGADMAGNEAIISSYPLSPPLLDPDPPKISILKPSDGERMESFPITIFGSSSDGQGSGVKVVELGI